MLPIADNIRSICFTQNVKGSIGEVDLEHGADNSAASASVLFVTSKGVHLHDHTLFFITR